MLHPVVFTVNDDIIPEPDETFTMRLMVTNGDGMVVEPSNGTVTIVANDNGFGIFGFVSVSI